MNWNTRTQIASKRAAGSFPVAEAEVLSIRWALEISLQNGFLALEVEIDSVSVIEAYRADTDFTLLEVITYYPLYFNAMCLGWFPLK